MNINYELLIADLTQKLRRGLIDPHGMNLEDDLRGAVMLSRDAQAVEDLEFYKSQYAVLCEEMGVKFIRTTPRWNILKSK